MITHCKESNTKKKMANMKNVTKVKSTEGRGGDSKCNLSSEKFGDGKIKKYIVRQLKSS